MNQSQIRNAFEEFLRKQSLKLTSQRQLILEKVFATHDHFSAETLYGWMREEEESVSRATVYRTLSLLVEGGFLESLDTGQGEKLYEHVLGHKHHDHLVCTECGRIEEFYDEEIERHQELVAKRKGWELVNHNLRLFGRCKSCRRKGGGGGESRAKKGGSTRRSTSPRA